MMNFFDKLERSRNAHQYRLAGLTLTIVLSQVSCRPAEVVTREADDHARLKTLVTIYTYAAAELNRPPKSVDDLQPVFDKASIKNPDELLTSTRDGEPFVVVWGVDLTGQYAGADVPIAYEREGLDGVRLLVSCDQQVREVKDSEFDNLEWPEGYEPEK